MNPDRSLKTDRVDASHHSFPDKLLDQFGRSNLVFAHCEERREILEGESLKQLQLNEHAVLVSELDEKYFQFLRAGLLSQKIGLSETEGLRIFADLTFQPFFVNSLSIEHKRFDDVPIFFPIMVSRYLKDRKSVMKGSNWTPHPFFSDLCDLIKSSISRTGNIGKRCELFHARFELLKKSLLVSSTLRSFFDSSLVTAHTSMRDYYKGFEFLLDNQGLGHVDSAWMMEHRHGTLVQQSKSWLKEHALLPGQIFHPTELNNPGWDLATVCSLVRKQSKTFSSSPSSSSDGNQRKTSEKNGPIIEENVRQIVILTEYKSHLQHAGGPNQRDSLMEKITSIWNSKTKQHFQLGRQTFPWKDVVFVLPTAFESVPELPGPLKHFPGTILASNRDGLTEFYGKPLCEIGLLLKNYEVAFRNQVEEPASSSYSSYSSIPPTPSSSLP